MRTIRSRSVGLMIEAGPPHVLVLFVDHVMVRQEYDSIERAEHAYAELADVFDLWGNEEMPHWIPARPETGNNPGNNNGRMLATSDRQSEIPKDSSVREGGLEPPHG